MSAAFFTADMARWARNLGGRVSGDSSLLFDGTSYTLSYPDGACAGAQFTAHVDLDKDGWEDVLGTCRCVCVCVPHRITMQSVDGPMPCMANEPAF